MISKTLCRLFVQIDNLAEQHRTDDQKLVHAELLDIAHVLVPDVPQTPLMSAKQFRTIIDRNTGGADRWKPVHIPGDECPRTDCPMKKAK